MIVTSFKAKKHYEKLLLIVLFHSLWNTTFAQNWIKLTNGPAYLQSGAISADGTKIIVSGNDLVCTSTNSGATWFTNNIANLTSPSWIAVASSADGTKLVAANGQPISGFIYTSTNSGTSWLTNNSPKMNWQTLASSADGTKLIAGSADGSVYTSSNSGMIWVSNNLPSVYYESVASSSDGSHLVAVGGGDIHEYVFISTNSGTTWKTSSLPALVWNSAAISADGKKLVAVCIRYGGPETPPIYTSTNSGTGWKSNYLYSSEGFEYVASSADGTRLAITGEYVFFSTNSGNSWFDSGAPESGWSSISSSTYGNDYLATAYDGVYIYHTTPPVLKIMPSGSNLAITWPANVAGFQLQQNSNLISANWLAVTNPVTNNSQNLQVTVSRTNGQNYYRLKSQ
jgi:hypothetical protein